MRRRRAQWPSILAGAAVIAGGVGVALIEVYRMPKGSIWVVVGTVALLLVLIRLLGGRRT
jgi:hypothetical protein